MKFCNGMFFHLIFHGGLNIQQFVVKQRMNIPAYRTLGIRMIMYMERVSSSTESTAL